jgi:hypothetical protein
MCEIFIPMLLEKKYVGVFVVVVSRKMFSTLTPCQAMWKL